MVSELAGRISSCKSDIEAAWQALEQLGNVRNGGSETNSSEFALLSCRSLHIFLIQLVSCPVLSIQSENHV